MYIDLISMNVYCMLSNNVSINNEPVNLQCVCVCVDLVSVDVYCMLSINVYKTMNLLTPPCVSVCVDHVSMNVYVCNPLMFTYTMNLLTSSVSVCAGWVWRVVEVPGVPAPWWTPARGSGWRWT